MTSQPAQGAESHSHGTPNRPLLPGADLASVLDAMLDGVLVFDRTGTLVLANAAARRMLPIEEPAPPLPEWPERYGIFQSDARTPLPAEQLPVSRTLRGEPVFTEELLIRNDLNPEGIWVAATAAPLLDQSRQPSGALLVLHDVTEARRAQQVLRRERDWASTILDTVGSLVVVLDREGRIVSFNRACEKTTGYSFEEVIGQTVWDLFVPPDEVEQVRRVFEQLRAGEFPNQHENHWVTRTGQKRLIVWSNTALLDAEGQVEYVIGTGIDVTERRLLEAQLRQAQKMEAVGRLASGVAHDFNNLLTIISGYAQMLWEGLPADSPLRDAASEILGAAGRAASLASRLLAFSRKQKANLRLVDVNELVSDLERMLRRLIGEDIELITVLSPNLPKIQADPVQLEQVLMNLVVNAREAMPEGGRIVIETALADLGDDYVRTHLGARKGPHVLLAVSDTGCGMEPDVLRQAFEPFFTTKESGTGLGLSTVYGIVQQHGGQLWAYSEPGAGTTFKIYLPAAEALPGPTQETPVSEAIPTGSATGVVLVVEDEADLRRLIAGILEQAGYRVLSAGDPEEALRIAAEQPGGVDLLLTDVVLPGMSGRQLADRLREQFPSLRVLYMSGYTDHAAVHNGALAEQAPFLEKPFSKQTLLSKVRAALTATH
jgi:two-component system cell cycle sensor histidine kinase/response regulator CckA